MRRVFSFSLLFNFVCASVFLSAFTPLKALEIHQLTTPKGIKVWFAPDKTVPVISMAFSFENAGSAHNPTEKNGLAMMSAALMTEGAGELDANGFADRLAELGIGISFSADADYFRGGFKTTLRTKEEAIDLLKDVLHKALLPTDRLEILRQQALASLKAKQKQPNYILGNSARKGTYGEHPYGSSGDGTLESLKEISTDDIKTFLKTHLARSNLKIAICANLPTEEVMQLVDSIFADLPSTSTGKPLPKPALSYSGQTIVTEQTIPQSVSLFYHPGLNTHDKNYMILSLVSAIFGSDFTSRLMQEVREKNGLAYTVQSFLSIKKEAASLGGFVGSENAKIEEAITRIKKEFSTLASFGVTEQELKDAKKAAIGSFVLRLSSTSAIAGQLLTYQEINYPASYLNERSGKINAIRLDDVNTFIKDFFDPQKLSFYVVGNPEKDLTK